jgi:hypothetical protein
MATSAEVWERLRALIMEQTAEGSGNKLLFIDEQIKKDSETGIKRGDKYIIGSIDVNAADRLQTAINDFLRDDHNKITGKDTHKPKEYKLNVKIVKDSSPDVSLRTHQASSTKVYSFDDAIAYLDERAKRKKYKAECKFMKNCLAIYYLKTGEPSVYITKVGGYSYKVEYKDGSETFRQISVGDILILVGADTLTTEPTGRKRRKDRLSKYSRDVIASARNIFIRKLPESVKKRLEAKGNA